MLRSKQSPERPPRLSPEICVNRWRLGESFALALYTVMISAGVLWHESWADEAQAWLMARDLGWWQLMVHGVRYEGTPGLWHALLWVLIRLHVSFAGMHWVAAAFAAAAVAVLMRFAPFPRGLRLLLPFTFFLAYQDAVVARSYVLFSVLAFGAAALLRGRLQRPRDLLLLALLLALMANLSIHCFLASLGLAVVAWVQRDRSRKRAGPVALLLLGWVAAIATAAPPPDVAFPAGKNISESWKNVVAGVEHKRYVAVKDERPSGELTPVPPPVHHRTGLRSFERKGARLLAVITFPLSTFRLLGLAAALLVLTHGWIARAGVGRVGLAPYLLLLVAFVSLYLAPRHTGVLFVTFLVTAWLTWPEANEEVQSWRRALMIAMLLLTIEQVGWTAHALYSDLRGPYSGGPMTAEFLREHGAGKRVAGFYYHSVAVLPYFDWNLYVNQRTPGFWDWSRANRSEAQAAAALATHPDFVVVGGFDRGGQSEVTADWSAFDDDPAPLLPLGDDYRLLPFFEAHGYHETHRFCGHAWMRFGYAELLCEVVLEPDQPSTVSR